MSVALTPVRIRDDDRPFLVSSMSDASVASMLGWTLARVQRARAWIAAETTERPLGASAQPPPEEPEAPAIQPGEPMIGVAIPSASADPAGLIGSPAAVSPVPDQPPADLSGAELAAWYVDNTAEGFAEIAGICGLSLEAVSAIADGEQPAASLESQHAPAPDRAPQPRGPSPYDTAHPRPPPVAPIKPATAAVSHRPTRLKQVSPDIVRWTLGYLKRGVPLSYLADLFDVDREDLALAVSP